MHILLLSTYDLGRQPFGLASPAAWLRAAGHDVVCVDLTRTRLDEGAVRRAALVACFLPMHTATRLALPVLDRIRALNPDARLCAYGLYAPLSAAVLREHGVDTILGPEFEADLAAVAGSAAVRPDPRALPRLAFRTPDRSGLPTLSQYAALRVDGERRTVGYTEASRGCKHRCRHCPIVPIYDGRFRIVPAEVVVADAQAQVAAGARHITFGDPDFFNGPTHAVRVVEALARACPGVSYDVTIKVEHLLRHDSLLPVLRDTGCAFVTSAVESLDDEVLARLDKGHTRADVERVVGRFADVGLALSPTFVAFTPWTTLDAYCDLLAAIDRLDLVAAVAPVQYAIRLLVPEGSRMLELPDMRARVTHFDARWLTHAWTHPDPRVDALQRQIEHLVGPRIETSRAEGFERVWETAHDAAGLVPPHREPRPSRTTIPYLDEPWYC